MNIQDKFVTIVLKSLNIWFWTVHNNNKKCTHHDPLVVVYFKLLPTRYLRANMYTRLREAIAYMIGRLIDCPKERPGFCQFRLQKKWINKPEPTMRFWIVNSLIIKRQIILYCNFCRMNAFILIIIPRPSHGDAGKLPKTRLRASRVRPDMKWKD